MISLQFVVVGLVFLLLVVLYKLYGKNIRLTIGPGNLNEDQGSRRSTIQVKKTTNSIRIHKENGEPRYLVNGVTYNNVDEIPDPALREEAKRAADLAQISAQALQVPTVPGSDGAPRQERIEIKKVNGVAHFVIDGTRYNTLDSIPDPSVRAFVQKLMETEKL